MSLWPAGGRLPGSRPLSGRPSLLFPEERAAEAAGPWPRLVLDGAAGQPCLALEGTAGSRQALEGAAPRMCADARPWPAAEPVFRPTVTPCDTPFFSPCGTPVEMATWRTLTTVRDAGFLPAVDFLTYDVGAQMRWNCGELDGAVNAWFTRALGDLAARPTPTVVALSTMRLASFRADFGCALPIVPRLSSPTVLPFVMTSGAPTVSASWGPTVCYSFDAAPPPSFRFVQPHVGATPQSSGWQPGQTCAGNAGSGSSRGPPGGYGGPPGNGGFGSPRGPPGGFPSGYGGPGRFPGGGGGGPPGGGPPRWPSGGGPPG